MPMPDSLASIGTVQISPDPPAIGMDGNLWYDPDNGGTYISLGGAWVPLTSSGSMPPAPILDGRILISEGGNWITTNIIDGGTF